MDPNATTDYAPDSRVTVAERTALYYVIADVTGVRDVQPAADSPIERTFQREELRAACARSRTLNLREIQADSQSQARLFAERRTECPLTVPDIATAAVLLLGGDDWCATPAKFRAGATITGPHGVVFHLGVDHDEDLVINYAAYLYGGLPKLNEDELPEGLGIYTDGVFLKHTTAEDGRGDLAARVANALRLVTGLPLAG
ncbi:hypothetical protein [Streptomyces niveus]|uniref:hypothetical protein n=1 Tax=Streptomyces niveus TaxID=193462 RepID=UPI003424EB93